MVSNPYYKDYKNRDIEGASPAEQVAVLLEKSATHIKEAKKALLSDTMERCYFYCEKAATIINALSNSLGHATPEQLKISVALDSYYTMLDQLIGQILSKRDIKSCDILIDSLYTLSSTWRQISYNLENQAPVWGDQERESLQDEKLSFST